MRTIRLLSNWLATVRSLLAVLMLISGPLFVMLPILFLVSEANASVGDDGGSGGDLE